MLARFTFGFIACLIVLGVAGWLAFKLSPWPGAWLIRSAFAAEGERIAEALLKHVPNGVSAIRDEPYDVTRADARLDVYFSPTAPAGSTTPPPTVVWIHGGGFVGGSKEEIGNYCRVLAGHGYTVVAVGYSLAPRARYPVPVRQANAALGHLVVHAERLHVNPARLVLAGDSGGAHIAAQLANAISEPAYATALGLTPAIARRQLDGVILYCGPYTLDGVDLAAPFGGFLRTVLWSYTGVKDPRTDPQFDSFSVVRHVTPAFPRTFISVGNADPLRSHSEALAAALRGARVPVDALFFPEDHTPSLAHEYQFDLDTDAGRLALERSLAFLGTP